MPADDIPYVLNACTYIVYNLPFTNPVMGYVLRVGSNTVVEKFVERGVPDLAKIL